MVILKMVLFLQVLQNDIIENFNISCMDGFRKVLAVTFEFFIFRNWNYSFMCIWSFLEPFSPSGLFHCIRFMGTVFKMFVSSPLKFINYMVRYQGTLNINMF